MKIIFMAIIIFSVIGLCFSDTKMKIKILPPEEDSKEPTRYLLNRFKNVMNDGMALQDSPLLNKINLHKDLCKLALLVNLYHPIFQEL